MVIAAGGHSQEGSEPDSPERICVFACDKLSNTPQTLPTPHDRRHDHRVKRVDCVVTFGYVQKIPPTRAQGEFEKWYDLLDAHFSIPIQEAELRYEVCR